MFHRLFVIRQGCFDRSFCFELSSSAQKRASTSLFLFLAHCSPIRPQCFVFTKYFVPRSSISEPWPATCGSSLFRSFLYSVDLKMAPASTASQYSSFIPYFLVLSLFFTLPVAPSTYYTTHQLLFPLLICRLLVLPLLRLQVPTPSVALSRSRYLFLTGYIARIVIII